MKILAIESSCDDTAAAVWANGQIVSNVVSSQLVHEQYGGVVPEVASRAHNERIYSVVESALETAGTDLGDLDAIACTQGPGLMGSLLVGFTFAKSLAQGLGVPFIGVHHMRAHILAHFIEEPKPDFPFLCLTVSGGHTQLVKCLDPLDMKIIGSTLDDAAGEAFDKIGKMLGLPYPAGPALDQLAQKGLPIFDFPEPQIPSLDFSFSGLKTSVLYFLRSNLNKDPDFIEVHKNDLCASVQERIVSILINKLTKAANKTDIQHIGIAGGVSANSALRKQLAVKSSIEGWHVFLPKLSYCTDNAAMVAMAAYFMYERGQFCNADARPDPRLKW
ncbi:MAG: tRNA (adenosine(37)-N6)-threonylcarbamoyltransferase complex transferase subunit TsaD [Saprospiraceae bacterium]|nr:tRNA (adenosine(37)-N6)-threonylcarbamoyltransferase complex transferase subunit TsaD [Saprospiraceae bacterium]